LSSSFVSLGVPSDLTARLVERGITDPYPIQAATLEESLRGGDVCAQAPTGSGKTLAFGIPLVARVQRARPRHPRALVLVPTRELAAQIATELAYLGAERGVRVATFYGGVGFGKQLDALRKGVEVAVACPGRLSDLLERGALVLGDVDIVVVDEADRMADMGFLPVVRRLLDRVGADRQTLLFSATLEGDVQRLVDRYQRRPTRHVLDAPTDAMGSRTHHFWRTETHDRAALTADLVRTHPSAIVFCRTKRGVDRLARQLSQAGIATAPLHGDRTQVQRDRALAAFQARQVQVLVGTDVAARGIHVDDVSCVVHFDPPEDETTYVHRSGRTGRAGATGIVVSLVTREQERAVRDIQQRLKMPTGVVAPTVEHRVTAAPPQAAQPIRQRLVAARPEQGRTRAPKGASSRRGGASRQRAGARSRRPRSPHAAA